MLFMTLTALAAPAFDIGAQLHIAPTGASTPTGLQMGVTASVRPSELFAVTGSTWGQLSTGQSDPVPLQVLPDATRVRGGVTVLADFSPISGTVVRRPFWLDLGVGPGVVNSQDDLGALQCSGGVACEESKTQWHPALAWAAGPRVALSESVGLRLQARGQHWIEVFEGVNLQRQSQLAFGMDIHGRFGRISPTAEPISVP